MSSGTVTPGRARLALAMAACGAALWLSGLSASSETGGQAVGTRHLYISALDKRGEPVLDLSPREVTVQEDGDSREIVTFEPARTPMQLALLVDDTGPGINFIRDGVNRFVARLQGKSEMALISTGGRNTLLVDFTSNVDSLYRGLRQLSTKTTTGAYLLDAIKEAVKVLTEREAARPVIVVLTLEGDEFSNIRPDRLLDDLQRSKAALHVVSLGKPTLKTMTGWNQPPSQAERENLDENINRKKVLQDGTKRSGGRYQQLLVDSGVPTTMLELADELVGQYVLVYRRPEHPSGPRKLNIQVSRPGIRIRARAEVS